MGCSSRSARKSAPKKSRRSSRSQLALALQAHSRRSRPPTELSLSQHATRAHSLWLQIQLALIGLEIDWNRDVGVHDFPSALDLVKDVGLAKGYFYRLALFIL